MNNNNAHFYANACHVCKRFGISLVRCSGCNLIAYCGIEHQQQHMSEHKELCDVVAYLKISPPECMIERKYDSPDSWTKDKETYMKLVENMLSHYLCVYEQEMFLFPRSCIKCHKRNDLVDCVYCASVSFCDEHATNPSCIHHPCSTLGLCMKLDTMSDQRPDLTYIQRLTWKSYYIGSYGSKVFFNNCIKPYITLNEETEETMLSIYSEYITQPLTLLNVMEQMSYNTQYKQLYIYILNSSYKDVETVIAWEMIFHFVPNLKYIYIAMTGMELTGLFPPTPKLCTICSSQGNQLVIRFHSYLDHRVYIRGQKKGPNFVLGFNVRIHTDQLKYYDMRGYLNPYDITPWLPIIQTLLENTSCPLIFTSCTFNDATNNITEMNKITNNQIRHHGTEMNPYSSLRPYRDRETEKPVFPNSYYNVYFK